MELLRIISGPALGTIIGFGTNYIAIKMLFRPHKEVKIAGKRLPFTPGIIPKRKPEIAKAVGLAVGNELFTKDDIEKILLSEDIEKSLSKMVIEALNENDKNLKENLLAFITEEKYDSGKKYIEQAITQKIQSAILKMNIGEIISREGGKAVKESVSNPLVKMFLNENTINGFAGPIGEKIEDYIKYNGDEIIGNAVNSEIENAENIKLEELLKKLNLDEEKIENIVSKIYRNIIINAVPKILEQFDIAKIVEEKINAMSIDELEKMILKIMKKELNAIITLGGVLGFLIGLLNILFVI
jgi:uncharacterized membrane protein YheB (UPF0754 family)